MTEKDTKTAHFTARDVKQTVIDDFNKLKSKKKKTSPEMMEILVNNAITPPNLKGKDKELQEQNDQLQQRIDQLDAERSVLFRDRDQLVGILTKYLDPERDVETQTINNIVQNIVDQYEAGKKRITELELQEMEFNSLNDIVNVAFKDIIAEFGTIVDNEEDNRIAIIKKIAERFTQLQTDHSKTQTELTGSITLKDDHQFICSLNKVIAHNARACRPFMVEDGLIKTTDPKEFPNELANLAIHNFLLMHYKNHIPNA